MGNSCSTRNGEMAVSASQMVSGKNVALDSAAEWAIVSQMVMPKDSRLIPAHVVAPTSDTKGDRRRDGGLTKPRWHRRVNKVIDISQNKPQNGSDELYILNDPALRMIDQCILGRDIILNTPFGKRRVIYSDYTASGRLLSIVEDYVRDVVNPKYANTHTEASSTGLQTTSLREEARDVIYEALNAPKKEYVVLFCGTGSTGAMDKIIRVLGIQGIPAFLGGSVEESCCDGCMDDGEEDTKLTTTKITGLQDDERPVVFIGPYEHHSNELMWRESLATVVVIEEDESGRPDFSQLEVELKRYEHRPLKIGSFSAGSNVTGICTDTTAIAELLHSHGALAFFDYAGTGAYVGVDMRPRPSAPTLDATKDAVYLSVSLETALPNL